MALALVERTQQLFSKALRVEGKSMEPTFSPGSWVRVSPFSYTLTSPKRGDVVALCSPEDAKHWELKRIVGLPGETITWNGGAVWINGLYLPELYVSQALTLLGEDSDQIL